MMNGKIEEPIAKRAQIQSACLLGHICANAAEAQSIRVGDWARNLTNLRS